MESRRVLWPGRAAVIPVAIVSLTAVMLTGCGSNSSDNTPATTSPTATATPTASSTATAGNTEALCRDADALRSSIADLRNVPLNANAVSALSSKVDAISAKLDQLAADAKGSLRPQTDKLSAALGVLKTSLRNAAASPSAANLSVIPSAITSVVTTGNEVRTALPDC